MKERILFLIMALGSLAFNSTSIFANYAKVTIVKGDVTQLAPGELMARKVKQNEELKDDTSILTGPKSFIRMVLQDGSTLSLGPESKIVLSKIGKLEKDKSVIGLLKGSLRNKVKKHDDGKMHFFVKTRTAALGVRGTEFETVYGPENGVTSLLTYQGAVSMAHMKNVEKTRSKETKEIEYSRESELDKSIVIEEEIQKKELTDPLEQIEVALDQDSASTVMAGQLSQTVDSMETVAKPTVINPVQLNLLYANDTFSENDERRRKADLDSHDLKIRPMPTDTPPEGLFDKDAGAYAPKAGGFFDRKTGLYIPPSEDALFDQENKVYIDKELGNVDSKTGEYVPPVGLEIDPLKGFVKKKIKDDAPAEFLAKVESNQRKLNSVLDNAIVVGDGPDKDIEKEVKYYLSYRELISKNVFTFSLAGLSQTFDVSNSSNGRNTESSSTGAFRTSLGIEFDSGSRLKPFVNLSFATNEFEKDSTNISQEGDKLNGFGIGLKYSIHSLWNLVTEFKMDQQYFVHFTSSNSVISSTFTRFSIPKFFLGAEGEFFRVKKLSGELGAGLGLNLTKTSGDMTVSTGLLYKAKVGLRYWPSKNWYMTGHLFSEGENNTVKGDSYIYDYDATRNSTGLALGFGSYF